MALFNQRVHLPEEKGEKQRPNMTAVNVGVAHDENFVIAQFLQIKFFTDAGPERVDDGADFFVG